MGTIDWIIIILIGLGVIQGLMQGFVKQLASIVGIIAGLLLARALFGVVAEQLAPINDSSTDYCLHPYLGDCTNSFVAHCLYYHKSDECDPSWLAEPLAG